MSSRTSPLKGRTAIVTGAARGLGRVYAHRLADLGASVGIVDIDLHSYSEFAGEKSQLTADTVVDELREKGAGAAGAEADLSDPAATEDAVESIVAQLGDVSILLANAGGGSGGMGENAASELDWTDLQAVVARNLYATTNSVRAVAKYMKALGYGKIVTVASEAGLQAKPEGTYAHYGAIKAAVVMYTKYLAQDLGRWGITVNCLSPGYVETGRMREVVGPDVKALNALRRFGTPEECAHVIEFLTTDLSSYVTGTVIDASGGYVRAPSQ